MSVEDRADTPPLEMLPEGSLPQIRFVIVLPPNQIEPLLELDHIEIKPPVPSEDSPPSEEPPKVEFPSPPKKRVAIGKSTTYSAYSPRRLFTDGWNSFWHLAFGILAIKIKTIVPLFIFYQFLDVEEINVFVDIIEFLCGYMLGYVFSLI
jgi:hypothetical protein